MAKYDYDMIVIGGGAGGLTSSTFAGQSAAKTLLIEKEEKLGGDCLHYGCVPSKSLIKSAYVANVIKNSEKYGLPKVELPKVDYKQVSQRIHKIVAGIQEHDEPEYIEKKYNVETKFGEPKFIDKHTIELKGEKITSRYFVISTGSSAFIPPVEGLKDVKYITNIEVFSLDKLPEKLIVMGGGPIGLEMAQAMHRLGSEVIILQRGDMFLPKEDRDIAEFVRERLEAEGLKIYFNVDAKKVKKQGDNIIVTVEEEKTKKQIDFEGTDLLIATGRKANIEGLDLEKAEIKYTRRGIDVNKKMQTSQKNIYAVGDVAGGYQFTHVAAYEAIVAITNAILKIPSKTDYTKTPWATYIDPEIASIGYNEQRAKEAGIEYIKHVENIEHNDRALAEGENKGLIKILMNKRGKVIGVQIVSFHAGDLIGEWIPVLNGNLKLSTISNAIHPYPTMTEINKNASVNYIVSTIPGWTKKVLKVLFGYQGKV